jgi:hypothetical protein
MKIHIMKKYILCLLVTAVSASTQVFAGNPDRAGGAGATQLLINPYGRSAGTMGANSMHLKGPEAMHFNVAGLAYTERTDFMINQVVYLQGTGVFMNNATLAQSLGNGNVIGLSVTRLDLGNIPLTTEALPDATLGTFTPQILNLGAAYAKKFSNSITGGITVRLFSEGVTNVRSSGVALDMGVMYQTALNPKKKIKKEDFRFGIAVRNIGPDASYSGSGLSFRSINVATGADRRALFASQSYNLPTLVHIGAAYDMRLDKTEDTYFHRLTALGNFNYNAFSNNITSVGLEYAYKETAMIRAGYGIEAENTTDDNSRTQYNGYAAGLTLQMPISKSGTMLGLDYSYAPTRVFNGIHNISLRFTLGNKKS